MVRSLAITALLIAPLSAAGAAAGGQQAPSTGSGQGRSAGSAPAPNIHGETLRQVAERTGYSVEEIGKCFPAIERWGGLGVEPEPGKLAESFARDRFRPPPKPGVHPRVYFNPEDLPEIRRRLRETRVGRLAMAGIRGRLLQASPKRDDWQALPYKPTPADYERYAAKGLHVDRRMGFRGPWVGGWINTLAEGKVPEELEKVWSENPGRTPRRYLMHLLPYEAFRCLIDDDAAGGRRVAAALTTLARRFQRDMPGWQKTDDWQVVYQLLSSHALGLTYDWSHQWMTDEQRAGVRRCIAGLTRGKRYLGLDQLPAFPGNTSNWNIIHANLLVMVLAIEGEAGYDPAVYARIVEGLRKWVTVASGPEGAPFEGLNKSAYGAQWLLPLATRAEPLIGTEYALRHVRKFLLHTMLPWGTRHVLETQIGPLRADIRFFKHAHPTDRVVDVLYGSTVRESFVPDARGTWPNIRTSYAPLWALFVADDPIGATGESYDFDAALDRLLGELAGQEPLTYFSDYRGLVVTRSAWTRDAMHLYFEPRHVPGGHTRASRNEFVLSAMGRVWAHRTVAVEDTSEMHSVVLIDGKGQGHTGGRCPAGRTVAMAEAPGATVVAADAAWAYGRMLVAADRKGARPVEQTPNDSRLKPSPLPWMARPWSFLPNWATGCKPAPGRDPGGHGYWLPYNPVRHAYRTIGLVRGPRPYVLVVDDVRKDDAEHLYEWLMQVPDDVVLAARAPGKGGGATVVDLILGEKDGDRRLLVRVLDAGRDAGQASGTRTNSRLETFETKTRRGSARHQRVVLPLRAAAGAFRVLLAPHRKGQPLPETTWNADRTRLTIAWGAGKDEVAFAAGADGRTRLALSRDGQRVVSLN